MAAPSGSPPPAAVPPPVSGSPPPPISTSPPVATPTPQSSPPPNAPPPPSTPLPSPPPVAPSPPPDAAPPPAPSLPPSPPPPGNPPPSIPIVPPPVSPTSPPPSPSVTPPPVPSPPPAQPAPPPPPQGRPPPPRPVTRSPPPPAQPPPPAEPSPSPPSPPSPITSPPPEAPANSPPPPQPSPPSSPGEAPPPAPLPPSSLPNSSTPSSPPPPSPILPLTPPSAPSGGSNSSGTDTSSGGAPSAGVIAGITVVAGVLALVILGVMLWAVKKRRKKGPPPYGNITPSPAASSQTSELPLSRSRTTEQRESSWGTTVPQSPAEPGLGRSKPLFSYEELVAATEGFSRHNLLGEGGFGAVYKGRLPDGRVVAVKQLKAGGGQGEREFRAELESISRIHHRHLVSLIGYCISDQQRLLIYEFVPNNTLSHHLHRADSPTMDWATRLRVAAGAARGIAYLHEDCHPRIIHRDIKSSNILLDGNFEARVSDFGLAKLAADAFTHVTTRVMGTFGYLAPEYASTGKLTDKSDVYSFGVVLLELITGRKPVDVSQPIGDESLVEWARPLMSHALESGVIDDLVDPKLGKDYIEAEMIRMIEVAAACVRHSAAMRPRMTQVVRALDGLGQSDDLQNGLRPGQSEIFHSAQQSEEIRLFQRMAFGNQEYSTDFSHSSWGSQ